MSTSALDSSRQADPFIPWAGARTRLSAVVHQRRAASARAIVDAIFEAVADFTAAGPHADDMTAVAVKITQ